ncbi:MAG: benzoylformate decarboxylase [Actinobacteria bacterium]|nr:benzoylformate decarboxylase [Actinomycetota bacterium]
MVTVRDAAYELFRSLGMTTVFGNPGSTELAMLDRFPADFRYLLGLQEAVVVGMADGYAQATGRPALANLHTTPGVGNAMGAIFNARANRSPVVITAGQQTRAQITGEALLTNVDATALPKPLVKWSAEPARAEDVPAVLARAYHIAAAPPRGPVFVSLPMDDWAAEADPRSTAGALGRSVRSGAVPDPAAMRDLAGRLARATRPALVVGGVLDADGGWPAAVALAERARMAVYGAPLEGRSGFPEDHPLYRGALLPAMAPLSRQLEGHDLVLVAGAPVFRYYPHIPGSVLPDGAELVQLTEDPDEAARALTGQAILGNPAAALRTLAESVPVSDRPYPEPAMAPPAADLAGTPLSPAAVYTVLAKVLPAETVVVNESPSSASVLRQYLPTQRPGGYFFGAGGGLGFGLPAAIGVQLADPTRPVVAVLGDGSIQYAITALWTAATYRVPITVVVMSNREYGILRWFAGAEHVTGVPGLELPGLDSLRIAEAYGVPGVRPASAGELAEAVRDAVAADGPRLIDVDLVLGAG